MNRTVKEAIVKCFHYDNHDQLRWHLQDAIYANNFGRRLKTLKASHTSGIYLQTTDFRSGSIHSRSNPSNPWIKHLTRSVILKCIPARSCIDYILNALTLIEAPFESVEP